MSLPTLVKTYQFNVNNSTAAQGSALADNRQQLINIVNAMTGFANNPWVVDYSCSSTTAGTKGDGVNRWTTQANLVWNNAGSAHSWIVLKQNGWATGAELLISLSNASGTGNVLTTKFSPSSGFTGGSTTADPTATDAVAILTNATWTTVGSDLAYRWSVIQSTDGANTIVMGASSGSVAHIWFFQPPANTPSAFPLAMMISGNATGTGTINNSIKALVNGVNPTTWAVGMEGANISANVLLPNDTNIGNIANEVTGNWPMIPLGLWCLSVGARGRQGTLVDLWYGSTSIATGDGYPSTGNQFVQLGVLIVPWNNGAINLT